MIVAVQPNEFGYLEVTIKEKDSYVFFKLSQGAAKQLLSRLAHWFAEETWPKHFKGGLPV